MTDEKRGGAPDAETADIGAPGAPVRERRMTAKRKQESVLRVLCGEPLETVARELRGEAEKKTVQWTVFPPNAADLGGWRDAFLEAGTASLKSRPRDDRDARIARLQTKLGEVTMDNELLQERIERMEAGRPLVRRRSKRCAPCSRSPRAAATGSPASAGSGASPGRASTAGERPPIVPSRRVGGPGQRAPCRMRRWSKRSAPRSPPAPFTAKGEARARHRSERRAERKVRARLRHKGVRTSKARVRRARRENRPPDGFLILLTARAPAFCGHRPGDAARGEPSVAP